MMVRGRWAIVGFVVVDVIALAVFVVLLVQKMSRTAVLDIDLTPAKAVITIDGRDYMSGAYRVAPGVTVATIKMDGFKEKTINVTTESDMITRVHDFLLPEDDNLNYYAQNDEDASGLTRFASEEARRIAKTVSIKDVLPIVEFKYGGLYGNSTEIVIDEAVSCQSYFCLVARGNFENEEKITEMLDARGYNIEDYDVTYERR